MNPAFLRTFAVVLLLPSVAGAQDIENSCRVPGAERFACQDYARFLAGIGQANELPRYDRAPSSSLGLEIGHYPVSGALGTGLSLSWSADAAGRWSVIALGVYISVDVTYLLMSSFWAIEPPPPPFRLRVGARLGIAVSESTAPPSTAEPSYTLVRPEMQPFVDLEIPLARDNIYAFFIRGAFDGTVNLEEVLRWTTSIGLAYGFDWAETHR